MFDRPAIGSRVSECILLAMLISLSTSIGLVVGRRCVCTSKACKEAGQSVCKTKFSCYTELILTEGQDFGENSMTRGCTEGATPLLCETKSWVTRSTDAMDRSPSSSSPSPPWIRMPWPRLKCCDTHDYCNADHTVNVSTWPRGKERSDLIQSAIRRTESIPGPSPHPETMDPVQPDQRPIAGSRESPENQQLQHRVKPLHVAALILAIAALISVLAACYVITRVMDHRYQGVPMAEVENSQRNNSKGHREP